jgi:hypothetical protein
MAEQDLLRKVSALLAKAEATDNEHEASAFFEKAHELMLRYSIDEQRVREAMGEARAKEKVVLVEYMFATYDHHAKAKAQLIYQLGKAHSVKMVLHGNRAGSNVNRPGNQGRYSQWCALIGFAGDIELVKMLYLSLLIQETRFGHQDWEAYASGSKAGRFGFLTGHMMGFARRIGERFEELNEKILNNENGGSRALVVRRDEEVNAAYREFFPRTGVVRRKGSSAIGNFYGNAAGDRADLGQKRAGSGSQRLIRA